MYSCVREWTGRGEERGKEGNLEDLHRRYLRRVRSGGGRTRGGEGVGSSRHRCVGGR